MNLLQPLELKNKPDKCLSFDTFVPNVWVQIQHVWTNLRQQLEDVLLDKLSKSIKTTSWFMIPTVGINSQTSQKQVVFS